MIKLAFPVRRLPRLSRADFQKYWFEVHGPLVRQHAEALGIERYVQLHTVDDPFNDALRAARGGPEPYDGIAELWWKSREELEAAVRSPAGQRAALLLLEDEKNFVDHSSSPLWIAEERPIFQRRGT
ncbi:MAG TPA: EthD domain-containing protein [Myxococcota bacterium]|nr:EthD domain-containing protein [Myxococcota bacterium]